MSQSRKRNLAKTQWKRFRARLVRWGLVPVLAGVWLLLDWWIALPEGYEAHYVGRESCVACHVEEAEKWVNSDHDLAMDFATPETVLGDFNNTQLEHYGITSKMSRRGDEFFVETEGPDGQRGEFKVKYVIGYRPLQQYMAELERGRVQVLPMTWDTEKKEWYCAVPDAPFGPQDPLHWTGSAQNWNHMCADCHTTDFAKNYDVKTHTHHYSFSEMNVSCEACHGPASTHVELAESRSIFWDRRHGYGLPKLNTLEDPQGELETCAPCHAHRHRIYPHFQAGHPFLDYCGLSLLEDHLYFADGQILEEVYVYGSFTQSLMYRKGVRCTKCHDPHTTRVKFPDNRLCGQCHMPAKYDAKVHHHHEPGTEAARCVECHMAERTYMGADPRRDHSLRRPRPDLTVSLGLPNACNHCHTSEQETAQWAADKIVEWYGPERKPGPHYGEVLFAGRRADQEAIPELTKLARSRDVGPIVRATAVSLLGTRYPLAQTQKAIVRALGDRDALIRAAALRAFETVRPTSREHARELNQLLAPMLNDPIRLVRTETARLLAGFPSEAFNEQQTAALHRAIDELKTGLLDNGDLLGSHVALGLLYTDMGRPDRALDEYRTAMRIDPGVTGPRSNLAQLLDSFGKGDEATQLRIEEAGLLERDARLLPENAPIHYRLGLLQYLLGHEDRASVSLARACELQPNSSEFLMALTLLYEKQQRWPLALDSAKKLCGLEPHNEMYQQIRRNIERAAAESQNTGAKKEEKSAR